jgi:hypothetical protein
MYICVYIFVYIYTHTYTHENICAYIHIGNAEQHEGHAKETYVCMHACICIYIYIYIGHAEQHEEVVFGNTGSAADGKLHNVAVVVTQTNVSFWKV